MVCRSASMSTGLATYSSHPAARARCSSSAMAWAVKAMIELNSDDLAKGIQSKAAIFPDLPPGVTASANSQIVRLIRVAKRDAK